ncbi:MAG: DUF1761 domain-containing protein [Saprospiraceae bacterium]|nr:DUF1761 domain-containing protein [Lewinella sp.]
MDASTLNLPAILVAAVLAFVIGGMWYSPLLFGKAWMQENGFSESDLQQGSTARIFGFAFLWSLVMAFNLGMFLNDPGTTASWGAIAGFLAGFGWIAMGIFIIGLFERRSIRYMLIHAAYMVVALTLMGLVIGLWR